MLRYLRDEMDAHEQKDFLLWLDQHPEQRSMIGKLRNESEMANELAFFSDTGRAEAWESLQRQIKPQTPKKNTHIRLWKNIAAAAIVLVTLSSGLYFYYNNSYKGRQGINPNEIEAGGNKATLTLSDGTTLSLTDAANGKLTEQPGVSITKTADGQLLYELKAAAAQNNAKTHYNTITTPTGGQFQLVLPDGTHVWLNAASSLTYPVSFSALKERKIELKGEAYFEVTKFSVNQVRLPFIVISKGEEVEVLGTHFNVNSYDEDGATAVTLLEGSVKVRIPSVFEQMIAPGQQALVDKKIRVREADTSTVVAWKNGLFKFENANIRTVMNQFSRWYDIDVAYEGKIPQNKFSGEIYRNMNAAKAFKILSYAKIKFRVEAADDDSSRRKIVISAN